MTKKFADSYPEKDEILQYLLLETGGKEDSPTNPERIIQILKLKLVSFDFIEFGERLEDGRAILSYNQKTIAINAKLSPHKINFSKFHEIAHYVLPTHIESFYFCKEHDMTIFTQKKFEEEANSFAADLIYKGDIFTIESNSTKISFGSIISLSQKYGSTIESTGRRFIEYSLYPSVFVVYEKKQDTWGVRYSIFSKSFLHKYLQSETGALTDDDNADVIKAELQANQIIESECKINFKNEKEETFHCEYFYNGYNVMGVIKEKAINF